MTSIARPPIVSDDGIVNRKGAVDQHVLKEFIMQEGHKMAEQVRPPISLTNAVSWRSEGIKHRKNEIFLDVVEKLNLLVSSNGTVLNSEIVGAVKMKVSPPILNSEN
mgnify:CR=1 FL=1